MRLTTTWVSQNDREYEIEIPDEEFQRLCERYGWYGIDWYFVNVNTIKYFDSECRCWRRTRYTGKIEILSGTGSYHTVIRGKGLNIVFRYRTDKDGKKRYEIDYAIDWQGNIYKKEQTSWWDDIEKAFREAYA